MTKLTTKARKDLPASKFAGPDRSFPVNNASHARAALSGATRALNAGNISPSIAAKVREKAKSVLKKDGGGLKAIVKVKGR